MNLQKYILLIGLILCSVQSTNAMEEELDITMKESAQDDDERLDWLTRMNNCLKKACDGDFKSLELILKESQTLNWINSLNEKGNTPLTQILHNLMEYEQKQANYRLITAFKKDSKPWDPYQAAYVKAIEKLIDSGADPEKANSNNETPFDLANQFDVFLASRIKNKIPFREPGFSKSFTAQNKESLERRNKKDEFKDKIDERKQQEQQQKTILMNIIENNVLGDEYTQKIQLICNTDYTKAEKLGKINLCHRLMRTLEAFEPQTQDNNSYAKLEQLVTRLSANNYSPTEKELKKYKKLLEKVTYNQTMQTNEEIKDNINLLYKMLQKYHALGWIKQ